MSTLVKTESFHAFEDAYKRCFGTSYVEEKKQELGRANVSRRIMVTKKEFIERMNSKGISTEMILAFVDSVRNCTPGTTDFINEYRRKNISTTEVVELINDIGLTRLNSIITMSSMRYDAGRLSKTCIMRCILLVGIMADVRIESYSALSLHGAYDIWCKSDTIIKRAYEFFSKVCFDYEKQIYDKLKNKIAEENPETMDEIATSRLNRQVADAMLMLRCGKRNCAEYGLDEEIVNMYSLLKRLIALIDGQCEWYWSND